MIRRITRSSMFLPTLREAPREAEIPSHQLLVRAGFIRRSSASGIYILLPLALRSLAKIESIIDDEMMKVGAQKVSMPLMLSSDLWKKTGRWESTGPELIRLSDRHENEFCLGPTHEEIFTDLVGNSLTSWKQLPLALYQVGRKYRDEMRPRFGLLRSREFIMKDCYSFHLDKDDATRYYRVMEGAYQNIMNRLETPWCQVEADSGNIGGSLSHEFHIHANVGEDDLLTCSTCGYGANVEKAIGKPVSPSPKFHVSLAVEGTTVVAIILPQGRKVNPLKLKGHVNDVNNTKIIKDELLDNINLGSLETLQVLIDDSLDSVSLDYSNYIGSSGGKMVEVVQRVKTSVVDAVNVKRGDFLEADEGDVCARRDCKGLTKTRGIEVGHIFYLGKKYSEPLGAVVADSKQVKTTLEMGCYGIGVSRIMAAVIENCHDDKGMKWPLELAPYSMCIMTVGGKKEIASVKTLAEGIYDTLSQKGTFTDDIIIDERDNETFGSKLTEAELIGYPFTVIVGKKSIEGGTVEMIERSSGVKKVIAIDQLDALQGGISKHAFQKWFRDLEC